MSDSLTAEELELLLENKSDHHGRVAVETVIDLLQAHENAARTGDAA